MTDESVRKAMHVLLDMVTSQDSNADGDVNDFAARTAFQNLDHDAIRVTEDDNGVINVDPTPLIAAAGMAIETLAAIHAMKIGQDKLTIINALRDHLDGLLR